MASPAVDFARSNQQRFLNELKDLLRIPSVSTLEEHKSDIQKAADYVASELRRIGIENVEDLISDLAQALDAPRRALAAATTKSARQE